MNSLKMSLFIMRIRVIYVNFIEFSFLGLCLLSAVRVLISKLQRKKCE